MKIYKLLILGLVLTPVIAGNVFAAVGTLHEGSKEIKPGMVVSLGENDEVIPATLENVHSLFGVVISNDASNDTRKPVDVATSGVALVSVSNINGNIEKGDAISASSIAGIGA